MHEGLVSESIFLLTVLCPACWFWEKEDGTKIYHRADAEAKMIRDQHDGVCPECGNTNIGGETIPA